MSYNTSFKMLKFAMLIMWNGLPVVHFTMQMQSQLTSWQYKFH